MSLKHLIEVNIFIQATLRGGVLIWLEKKTSQYS